MNQYPNNEQQANNQQQYSYAYKPNTNLVWAILSTLFCCLPLGIVAIVKASQVDTLWFCGKYNEAIAAAESAKKWSIIAAVVGVLFGFALTI